jgi:hypothetical protein
MPGRTAAVSAAGDHIDLVGQAQVPGLNADRGAERLDGCRVVDEDVGAARREHRRRRHRALPLVGEVGGHHADPPGRHALFPEHAARLLQLSRGAGEQYHPGPGAGQPERDGPADAAPRAGDQCGLAGEVCCHCVLLG